MILQLYEFTNSPTKQLIEQFNKWKKSTNSQFLHFETISVTHRELNVIFLKVTYVSNSRYYSQRSLMDDMYIK